MPHLQEGLSREKELIENLVPYLPTQEEIRKETEAIRTRHLNAKLEGEEQR